MLQKILSVSHPRVVQNEEVVIIQGDEGDLFYLILSGSCDVYTNQTVKKGKIIQQQQNLNSLVKGNFFGEISLIHNCIRTTTVKSNTSSTLAVIQKHDFLEFEIIIF